MSSESRLSCPSNICTTKTERILYEMYAEKEENQRYPFLAAFQLAKDDRTSLYSYTDKLMENKSNFIQESLTEF